MAVASVSTGVARSASKKPTYRDSLVSNAAADRGALAGPGAPDHGRRGRGRSGRPAPGSRWAVPSELPLSTTTIRDSQGCADEVVHGRGDRARAGAPPRCRRARRLRGRQPGAGARDGRRAAVPVVGRGSRGSGTRAMTGTAVTMVLRGERGRRSGELTIQDRRGEYDGQSPIDRGHDSITAGRRTAPGRQPRSARLTEDLRRAPVPRGAAVCGRADGVEHVVRVGALGQEPDRAGRSGVVHVLTLRRGRQDDHPDRRGRRPSPRAWRRSRS